MKIHRAAELLGVCEFDLFRQALAASRPNAACDDLLAGRAFEAYVADGVTPIWVRQYVSTVVETLEPIKAVA